MGESAIWLSQSLIDKVIASLQLPLKTPVDPETDQLRPKSHSLLSRYLFLLNIRVCRVSKQVHATEDRTLALYSQLTLVIRYSYSYVTLPLTHLTKLQTFQRCVKNGCALDKLTHQ